MKNYLRLRNLFHSGLRILTIKQGMLRIVLFLEAVRLLNDVSLEDSYAEKYAAVHPRLYWNILENGKHMRTDDMVSIGIKAMKTIPKKYMIRSRGALRTAEYMIAADGESLLEKCYFAA